MSFLTPLYVLGLTARGRSARVSPDPPVTAGRGAVQLADVSGADSAATHAAKPAGPFASAAACERLPVSCSLSPLPGRFCARRLAWDSATSSGGGWPC